MCCSLLAKKCRCQRKRLGQLFFRTDSVIFIGAAFGLVTFLYPVSSGIYIPWWMKLAGFSIFPLLIPMIYFFQVMAIAVTASRFPNLSVFEPVLLLVTTFFIEIVNHTANPFLFGEEWERRCCRTLAVKDSHHESMRLDGRHEQAQARPLPHDELVSLQRCAPQARVVADLAGQGDGLARVA